MEANWMKSISSNTLCNFFYFFFVFYAVISVITLVSMIGVLGLLPMPRSLKIAFGGQSMIMFVLAATGALFHYLICERALLAAAPPAKVVRGSPGMNPDMM